MTTTYRYATPEDRRFVVSSWSSSLRTSDRAGLIAMVDWEPVMHAQIGKILDRPSAVTVLAADRDTAVLQGFICVDKTPGLGEALVGIPSGLPIVFYCYVKTAYRRLGIARALFRSVGIDPMLPFTYACRTMMVGKLSAKIPRARHDHLRARYPEGARS